MEWNMRAHRFWCGFVGLISVLGLVAVNLHLPHYDPFLHYDPYPEEQTSPAVIPQFDRILAWYVWCSHLAYSLVGPNND